jgi:hypothetical protein
MTREKSNVHQSCSDGRLCELSQQATDHVDPGAEPKPIFFQVTVYFSS